MYIQTNLQLSKFRKGVTSNDEFQTQYAKVAKEYSNLKQFFVDASYKDGIAFNCMLYYPYGYKVSRPYTSNNPTEAEIVAIHHCILYICSRFANGKFVIYSDSRSAIHTVKVNKNLIRWPSSSNYIIVLVWVPSHVGIAGNEIVDTIAGYYRKQLKF